jgi:hypothetical protein
MSAMQLQEEGSMVVELNLSLYQQAPPPFDLTITLDEETRADIAEVLQRAEQSPEVKDDQSLAVCIEQAKEIKLLINGIEESRESLKKPFLLACRVIDDAPRKARAKLGEAYADLMSAAAIYESAQKQKREAEKSKHEAQLERLARQAHAEADEAKLAELIRQAQDAAIAANKVTQSSTGMALTKSYKFEIENLEEVWNFNRRLLKIELSQSACMDLIRMMRDGGATEYKIPGIKVTEITGARVSGK